MTRRTRRIIVSIIIIVITAATVYVAAPQEPIPQQSTPTTQSTPSAAAQALDRLEVKGRAPKTGYSRDAFGDGWSMVSGCSTRNIILFRDLVEKEIDDECRVIKGTLNDPYSGAIIMFTREDSDAVQIDHVVALSDAWQKGAQQLTEAQRIQLANDPLELLSVDGSLNQQKGDSDAATWLPPLKSFRCAYVARQIAVKEKYALWVTQAEKDAMANVLSACPTQMLPEK